MDFVIYVPVRLDGVCYQANEKEGYGTKDLLLMLCPVISERSPFINGVASTASVSWRLMKNFNYDALHEQCVVANGVVDVPIGEVLREITSSRDSLWSRKSECLITPHDIFLVWEGTRFNLFPTSKLNEVVVVIS